jgi:hypothetical protein
MKSLPAIAILSLFVRLKRRRLMPEYVLKPKEDHGPITSFIPLREAWICPECELLRKGPGACACGNSETVPAMRELLLPDDSPPIVSFQKTAISGTKNGVVRRKINVLKKAA